MQIIVKINTFLNFLKAYFQENKVFIEHFTFIFRVFYAYVLICILNVLRCGLRCPDVFVFKIAVPVEFVLNCLKCPAPGW